jgi:hypothetical protein
MMIRNFDAPNIKNMIDAVAVNIHKPNCMTSTFHIDNDDESRRRPRAGLVLIYAAGGRMMVAAVSSFTA